MVHYYFAYGSNMNPARVKKRKMEFHSHERGSLEHYRFAFNKRSVKYPGSASANVNAEQHHITEGVVYRLKEPEQITMMDPYEGYPIRYNRLALPIQVETGVVEAWVYIANDDYVMEGLRPNRWYLEHLLSARAHLSDGYYEMLAATLCLPDSDVEPE